MTIHLTAKMNRYGHIEIFNNNTSIKYLQSEADTQGFTDSLNRSQKNALDNFKYINVLPDNLFYDQLLLDSK